MPLEYVQAFPVIFTLYKFSRQKSSKAKKKINHIISVPLILFWQDFS